MLSKLPSNSQGRGNFFEIYMSLSKNLDQCISPGQYSNFQSLGIKSTLNELIFSYICIGNKGVKDGEGVWRLLKLNITYPQIYGSLQL